MMDRAEAEPRATNSDGDRRPRVVLFGMRCAFTQPVLEVLANAPDIDVVAVVLPGGTPRLDGDPVQDIIHDTHTPLIEVPDGAGLTAPDVRATMEGLPPDAIVVACFPWRLPAWLLALPPRGCLNVHPSLLPDGRGPEPVFWAFRWGLEETGVTLHLMDEGFDTGPVVAQRRLAIPEDATIPRLERSLAGIGARMVLDHLRSSAQPVVATAQRGDVSRYAPVPSAQDLIVPTSWSGRHAARFVRAVAPVYGPVPILVLATGQRLVVDRVVQADNDTSPSPVIVGGETARIRFADGSLTCRVARSRHALQIHQA